MKIFLDTANITEIKQAHELGIIDGVTTNPSLVSKEGGDYGKTIAEILKIVDGPISVEVVSEGANEMVAEAMKLNRLSHNVVVKIPITKEGLKAIKILSNKKIKTNATLAFSSNQTLLAAKSGATYVSIFIGRLDDNGHDGMQVVRDTVEIFKQHNFKTEIIVASIRHPLHVIAAAKSGAQIATIPFDVLEKMIKHPLTDAGIKKFLDDWNKRR